jgi:hypothetical protein
MHEWEKVINVMANETKAAGIDIKETNIIVPALRNES